MIVEVTFGLQNAVPRRKHMCDGFLRRGLARRPGYPDKRLRPKTSHSSSKLLQADERINYREQTGFSRITRGLVLTDNSASSALLKSLFDEVVPVQAFAPNCEEQVPRLHGSR